MKAKNPSRVHLVFEGENREMSLMQGETLQINNGTVNCVVIYAVVEVGIGENTKNMINDQGNMLSFTLLLMLL